MCGRYTLTVNVEALERLSWIDELRSDHLPRYNITPGQYVPVVRSNRSGRSVLDTMRWGLVPSWAEDPNMGYRLVNAAAETAHREPAFQEALRFRRCLVPADGFYKIVGRDGGPRQPYWIHRPDRSVFPVAGLWELWASRERARLRSFTVLTIPNPGTGDQSSFDRMPAVLDEETRERWMTRATSTDELRRLLLSSCVDDLASRPVSRSAINPTKDGPECIEAREGSEASPGGMGAEA